MVWHSLTKMPAIANGSLVHQRSKIQSAI